MKIVFYDVQEYETEYLKKHVPDYLEQVYTEKSLHSQQDIEDGTQDAEILSVFITSNLNREMLSRFKNLKFILTRSVGFSHIDTEYCKEKGIKVYNTPHYGDSTIAEFTFGLLLGVGRKISQGAKAIKEGDVNLNNFIGFELEGKTFGIIGLGAIGKKVAKIAEGFEMNVIVYDIYNDENYNCVSLDDLFENADIISIHCPLTEETNHLLNEKSFNKMKNGVVILNTARGEIIDTKALVNALNDGKVAYAGLDVIECEEITCNIKNTGFCTDCIKESCLRKYILNQRLLSYSNVLITPHIAYNSKEAIERILKITVENLNCSLNNSDCKKNLVLV
jgi:D-lactate dehydrogenase